MENLYEPFEVLISEEGEVVVLVEPDGNIEQLIQQDIQPEIMVDVNYDEDEENLLLLISVIFGDTEIFFGIPYGEIWDNLIEKEMFAIAFISRDDFESGKFDDVPILEIGLDELTVGFIEGVNRTAQELLGELTEEG